MTKLNKFKMSGSLLLQTFRTPPRLGKKTPYNPPRLVLKNSKGSIIIIDKSFHLRGNQSATDEEYLKMATDYAQVRGILMGRLINGYEENLGGTVYFESQRPYDNIIANNGYVQSPYNITRLSWW